MGISRVVLGIAAIALILLIMIGIDAIQSNRGDAWGLVIVCFALLLITVADFFRLSKFRWLPRLFSITVSVLIIHYLYISLSNSGFFISSSCNCTKVISFWPLIFMSVIGFLALNYSIWKSIFPWYDPNYRVTISTLRYNLKRSIWWLCIIFATYSLVTIFYNNLTTDVIVKSFSGAVKFIGYILIFILVFASLIFIVSAPEARRRKICRQNYMDMPENDKEQVFKLIDDDAVKKDWFIMHIANVSKTNSQMAKQSKMGGTPTIPSECEWPTSDSNTLPLFLGQLELTSPRLGKIWQGRVIQVFIDDYEFIFRSYSGEELEFTSTKDITNKNCLPTEFSLTPLRIAYPDNSDLLKDYHDGDTAYLVKNVSGMKDKLSQYTKFPEILLEMILFGFHDATMGEQVLEANEPAWIQDDETPMCNQCNKKMRFLFQFGDFSEDLLFGDTGVAYIFGCDEHPTHCEGILQSC